MAQCLARSQPFSQFIRPMSLLSYTSKSKTDCVFKYYLESNYQQRIECNASSFEILVLLALFLLVSHTNAFTSLSSVAGNQVEVNHLTWLQQPIRDSTNEASRISIRKETKRIYLNDVHPNNLSQINNDVLSNHSNQRESLADRPGIDDEINYPIAATDSSQPTPINLDNSGLCQSTTMTNQHSTAHLHLARPQSFLSAKVPFSIICPFGGLSCWVQSLEVKVQASSTPMSRDLIKRYS